MAMWLLSNEKNYTYTNTTQSQPAWVGVQAVSFNEVAFLFCYLCVYSFRDFTIVNAAAADIRTESVQYSYFEVNGKQYGYQEEPYDVKMSTAMDFKMWLSPTIKPAKLLVYSWEWTSAEESYLVSSSLRPYYNNKTYDNSILGIGVVQTYTYSNGTQKVNTYKGYNDSTNYCEVNYNDF